LSRLARSLAEHLVDHPRFDEVLAPSPSGLVLPPSAPPPSYAVHPHCHARASGAAAADVRLLERLGATVEALDAGCCGMAGSFGFRAEHEKWARKIGEDWWLPRVRRAAESSAVVVDGFSCVTQLEHLDGGPCIATVDIVRERLADRAAGSH
jgi:Fe-S oxidoreductase